MMKGIGSLVPERGQLSGAANDGPTVPSTPAAGKQELDRTGWDPFEVWRTRVKEARARTTTASPLETGKN
jgi:hypothetical protein